MGVVAVVGGVFVGLRIRLRGVANMGNPRLMRGLFKFVLVVF